MRGLTLPTNRVRRGDPVTILRVRIVLALMKLAKYTSIKPGAHIKTFG